MAKLAGGLSEIPFRFLKSWSWVALALLGACMGALKDEKADVRFEFVSSSSLQTTNSAGPFQARTDACYFVNVTGDHQDLRRIDLGGNSCPQFPGRLGLFAGGFGKGSTIDLRVPVGPNRRFDLLGVKKADLFGSSASNSGGTPGAGFETRSCPSIVDIQKIPPTATDLKPNVRFLFSDGTIFSPSGGNVRLLSTGVRAIVPGENTVSMNVLNGSDGVEYGCDHDSDESEYRVQLAWGAQSFDANGELDPNTVPTGLENEMSIPVTLRVTTEGRPVAGRSVVLRESNGDQFLFPPTGQDGKTSRSIRLAQHTSGQQTVIHFESRVLEAGAATGDTMTVQSTPIVLADVCTTGSGAMFRRGNGDPVVRDQLGTVTLDGLGDPYVICTRPHWQNIQSQASSNAHWQGKHFHLAADLNLDATGERIATFRGTLNGRNRNVSIGGSVTLFTGGGPNLGLFELIDGGVIQDFRLSISSVGTISWTPTAPDFGFGLLVGKATGAARLENIRLFLNSGFNVPVPNGSFGTVVGVLDGTSKLIDAKVASFHATTASPTIINGSAGVAGLLVGFVRSGAEVQRSSVLGYIQLESSTNTAYLGGAIGYLEGRAEGVQVGNTIGLRSTAASLSNANLGGLVSKAFNNAILRFSSTGLVPDFANTPDSGAGLGGFVGRCEGTSTLQGLWSTNNVAPTTVPTNTGSVIGHSAVTCSALQIRHQSWSSGVFGGVAPSTINGVEAWTAAVDPSRWAGLESAARLAGFKMHGRPGSSVNNYPTLLSDDVVMGTSVTDSDVRGPLGSDRFRLNIPADPSPVPDRNAILFPALATAIDTPVDYPALRYAFSFRIDSMNPSAALNNMSFAIGICRGGRSRLNITTPTVVSQTINSAGEVLLCGTLATDDFVGIAKSAPDTSFGARLDGAPFANGTAISESQIVNRNVTMLVDMPARQISFLSDGQVFADISLPTAAQFTPIVAFGRHGPGGQLGISRNWGWEQSTQVWVADDYDDAFSPGFLGFWGGP